MTEYVYESFCMITIQLAGTVQCEQELERPSPRVFVLETGLHTQFQEVHVKYLATELLYLVSSR